MTLKVAINGFGRIGRNILRAHYEDGKKHGLQFVAINDLGDAQINAHLLTYDTAHGRFPGTIGVEDRTLVVNGDRIKVLAERDPAKLPWKSLGIDAVLECTDFSPARRKPVRMSLRARRRWSFPHRARRMSIARWCSASITSR
jgi:glyceraldehyde 3-phosphate dehydrogenase